MHDSRLSTHLPLKGNNIFSTVDEEPKTCSSTNFLYQCMRKCECLCSETRLYKI